MPTGTLCGVCSWTARVRSRLSTKASRRWSCVRSASGLLVARRLPAALESAGPSYEFLDPAAGDGGRHRLAVVIRIRQASAVFDEQSYDRRLLLPRVGRIAPAASGVLNRQVQRRGTTAVLATGIGAVCQ